MDIQIIYFYLLATENHAAMNMDVQISFWDPDFNSTPLVLLSVFMLVSLFWLP